MGMLLIYLAFLICIKQLGRFFHGIFQDNKNSTSAYDINNAYLNEKSKGYFPLITRSHFDV
jgi:hypothetical protein